MIKVNQTDKSNSTLKPDDFLKTITKKVSVNQNIIYNIDNPNIDKNPPSIGISSINFAKKKRIINTKNKIAILNLCILVVLDKLV